MEKMLFSHFSHGKAFNHFPDVKANALGVETGASDDSNQVTLPKKLWSKFSKELMWTYTFHFNLAYCEQQGV